MSCIIRCFCIIPAYLSHRHSYKFAFKPYCLHCLLIYIHYYRKKDKKEGKPDYRLIIFYTFAV